MKYRFLSDEELSSLEDEFKQFLITNHLYAEEWEELNKTNPEKARDVVGMFSDLVLEKVYSKTKCLLHHSANKLKVFSFQDEMALLIGLDYSGEGIIPEDGLLEFIQERKNDFEVFSASKKFTKENRNSEVYSLVKNGAVKIEPDFFSVLSKLVN